ncbi:MAG: MarR family transcriptional regulator [Bacteroidota bacterium]
MNLDKQLSEVQLLPTQNWGKLISVARKQFEEWTLRSLTKHGYANFKIAYMPVLMNIGPEGMGNKELAQRARVTKQAMSKVLKELQDSGYITSKVSKEDKRNSIISLNDKGKKLVVLSRQCMIDLMDQYRNAFGKKDFDAMLQLLQKMIEYNDKVLLRVDA